MFRLPSPLRALAGGAAEVPIEADTVAAAAARLAERHPALRPRLLAPDGQLRSSVALYLNDRDVREADGGATRLEDGDVLEVIPALAGGSERPDGETDERSFRREELVRYSRHLLLPEVGAVGQRRLRAGKVVLVGAGGLGSPAALYLAAAGVGEIGLVDFDRVDASNLQRQVLYTEADVGRIKPEAARDRLRAMNPGIHVSIHPDRLTAENALETLRPYDVVIDGSDNFPTRYLVNDASLLQRIPVVHGSIFRFEGQVTVFDPYNGPCYRCLIPEPPPAELAPSCAEAGVLGVLPGIVGSIQAVEAIKMLLRLGDPLVGRLLAYDALEESFRTFKVRRDPECPACGEHAGEIVIAEYDDLCMPHTC